MNIKNLQVCKYLYSIVLIARKQLEHFKIGPLAGSLKHDQCNDASLGEEQLQIMTNTEIMIGLLMTAKLFTTGASQLFQLNK